MDKTTIEEAEKVFHILNLDFKDVKDKLNYKINIDDFKNLSNLQKWLLYDKCAKKDADIVLKSNKSVLKVLGWDSTYLDAIFPVRQILYTLFKTIGQEINETGINELSKSKKGILEIIDKQKLCEELKKRNIEPQKWIDVLEDELEKNCKNVHTIGNYMPCPDSQYNGVKGFQGKWHYNDRIDLLYTDLLKPKCKNAKSEDIIKLKQRNKWKKWFDKEKENLFLCEILEEKTIDDLSKFGCLKKTVFSDDELKELPFYLYIANELICKRNEKITLKCAEAIQKVHI